MRRVALFTALLAIVVPLINCGSSDSSSLAAPTPSIPNVVGNYSGSITINYQLIGRSISCPATTTVTQSSANVTFAPMQLGGVCPSLGISSLPFGDFTITNTGSMGSQNVNNIYMAACNGYYNATASGGFFGSSFQFSLIYTVASGAACVSQIGNFTFSGTLNRN